MLEVKDGRWVGRLDDDSPKVKWMRCVYPLTAAVVLTVAIDPK